MMTTGRTGEHSHTHSHSPRSIAIILLHKKQRYGQGTSWLANKKEEGQERETRGQTCFKCIEGDPKNVPGGGHHYAQVEGV